MSVCRTCSFEDIYSTCHLFSNHLGFKKETIQRLISKNGKAIFFYHLFFFWLNSVKYAISEEALKTTAYNLLIYIYICRINKYWLQRYNLKTKPKTHTLCLSWGMISQLLDISNTLFF